MDVREKLVELLRGAVHINSENVEKWILGGKQGEIPNIFNTQADHLIAHGVTVQEWISVKDGLPEDMVDVLTCDEKGNIHIMWHHHEYQYPFNIGRNDIRYFPVTYWCYLPQPPKGE